MAAEAPDFDLLCQRASVAGSTIEDKDALWDAAFRLDAWHFIARGTFPDVHLYMASNSSVADGRAMLKAFTDSERLHRFSRANGLLQPNGEVSSLSIPVAGVIRDVGKLVAMGAFGIHFNADVESHGFFVPLAQLTIIEQHLETRAQPRGLTTRDAYLLGHLPHILGIHFDGNDILTTAQRGAQGELAARVSAMVAGWPARGPAAVANVRRIEAILRGAGRESPPPPRDSNQFGAWSAGVGSTAKELFADRPGSSPKEGLAREQCKWAHLLGVLVGDAVHTLNLGAITHHLLDAAPDHPFLRAQATALGGGQAQGSARLRKVVEAIEQVHALSVAARGVAARAAAAYARAAIIGGSGPPGQHVAGLQTAMHELAELDVAVALEG